MGKRQELGGGRRLSRALLEDLGEEQYDERVLGSGQFVEDLRTRRELESKFPCAMEIEDIITRVCRYYEIDPEELRLKSRARRIADARSIICYLAVRQTGHSGVEVGRQVTLSRAGVSVAAGRGEQMVKNDLVLLALIDK